MATNLKLDDLQSYDGIFGPSAHISAATEQHERGDQRRSSRRAVDAEVRVNAGGTPTVDRTLDISEGGMSVQSIRQYAVGTEAEIDFTLQQSELRAIVPTVAGIRQAKVVYCFYLGEAAYRAGFEFLAPSALERASPEASPTDG